MPAYVVDLDALDDTVHLLAARTAVVDDRLAELERCVTSLHLRWTGAAAAAHLDAHRLWLAGAGEMREGLATMRAAAATAHANYSSAVAANVRMWA